MTSSSTLKVGIAVAEKAMREKHCQPQSGH